MTPLTAIYDFAVMPVTFDCAPFFVAAEVARKSWQSPCMNVVFVADRYRMYSERDKTTTLSAKENRAKQIVIAMAGLVPSVAGVSVVRDRNHLQFHGPMFPSKYKTWEPVSYYETNLFPEIHKEGGKLQVFAAPKEISEQVKSQMGHYVTITLRESAMFPERNSNVEAWHRMAMTLESKGVKVIMLHDTEGDDFFNRPNKLFAQSLHHRMALYENAVMNFGVSNGPLWMAVYSKAPLRMFKLVVPEIYTTTEKYLTERGFPPGEQPPWFNDNQRFIWKNDTYEVILAEAIKCLNL